MRHRMTLIASAVAVALALPAYGQQQSQTEQQKNQQQQGQQQQQKGTVSISGEVVGNADIKTTAGDLHRVVKVRTSDGRTVIADLGFPGPLVSQGDRIFVSGRSARINGKPVIFARYAGKLEEVGQHGGQGAGQGGQQASAGAGQKKENTSVITAWDAPDWMQDDYGYYDENLNWTADNSGFTGFYGDSDNGWLGTYDDVGDEGWLDV